MPHVFDPYTVRIESIERDNVPAEPELVARLLNLARDLGCLEKRQISEGLQTSITARFSNFYDACSYVEQAHRICAEAAYASAGIKGDNATIEGGEAVVTIESPEPKRLIGKARDEEAEHRGDCGRDGGES